MISTGGHSKKSLEFDINLVPFIDLLAVCICYLLLTAVWVQIGTMNIKQAIGGTSDNSAATPALWATLNKDGKIALELKNAPKVKKSKVTVNALAGGKPDLTALKVEVDQMKAAVPELITGVMVPAAESAYEDVVTVMDEFKTSGVTDVGVTAL